MLGLYEKRSFPPKERIWLGKYKNLTNALHWHPECELIRVICGHVDIKIGDKLYHCTEGMCLFCGEEELHYIHSQGESVVDVMIFNQDIAGSITGKYTLSCPLLSYPSTAEKGFRELQRITAQKLFFQEEALEVCAKGILVDLFNHEQIVPRTPRKSAAKKLTEYIHKNIATVTFSDTVRFSGYSAAHFSKVFKQIAGMPFTEYLNYIKTQHAVSLIQGNPELTMAEICSRCGFGTIRNFNRVFKSITGFSPTSLPSNFTLDISTSIRNENIFDPTEDTSVLL